VDVQEHATRAAMPDDVERGAFQPYAASAPEEEGEAEREQLAAVEPGSVIVFTMQYLLII
jgi:hypothetical protein